MGVCIYTFCFAMSRIVRTSKYRHVFGTAEKRENCFDGVKVSGGAWDSNKVAAGNKFVAAIWEAGGGGSFAVLANEQVGKLSGDIPLVTGHKAKVLDVAFSRFNDNLVASVSEDGNGRVWSVPDGGLTSNLTDPVQTLIGHKRKVGSVNFHPTADNVLATSSTDYTVKVWDIEKGEARATISGHSDIINPSTGITMVASLPPPPRTRRSVSSILVKEPSPRRPMVTLVSRDPAASGSASVEPSSTLVSLALLIARTRSSILASSIPPSCRPTLIPLPVS